MKYLYLFIVLCVFSCNKANKEYHDNGKIKKKYFKKNDKYEGQFLEYFENGFLKEKHKYFNGVKIDSSFYYNSTQNLVEIKIWKNNETHKSIIFNDKNEIEKEGLLSNKDSLNRIGVWRFSKKREPKIDSLVEYKFVNKKSYANQIWLVKNEKDTLISKGNFFNSLIINDTSIAGDVMRLRFVLTKPFFSNDSEMFVIVPYKNSDLTKDFSNIYEIKHDTFPSLINDGIPHPEVADLNLNHITEFGLKYSSSGKKIVRGIIVEKSKENNQYVERRLFFEEHFFYKKNDPKSNPNLKK